jgi:predicted transcriptional regulator
MNLLLNDSRADSLFKNASEIYASRPLNKNRQRHTVWSRAAISVILREEGYSYHSIGLFLGINHATVMHHFKRHKDNLVYDREYQVLFDKFRISVSRNTLNRIQLLGEVDINIKEALLSLGAIGLNENESEEYLLSSIKKSQLKKD